MIKMICLVLAFSTMLPVARAQQAPELYKTYYVIDEPQAQRFPAFQTPIELVELQAQSFLGRVVSSLMHWSLNRSVWPDPQEAYDRLKQFGTWVGGRGAKDCITTRAMVLQRDSEEQVGWSSNGCTVKSGKWHDPYAGEDHTSAGDIQIDHMVPLKNAYLAGASNWSQQKRCMYANFMANGFHLLAVSGSQNQAKGDRTPAEWMPPETNFHCAYLKSWLSVKLIWGLIMSPQESDAIKQKFADAHCDAQDFMLSQADLNTQRRAIEASFPACH